ncbi:precorrin-2 C(20)-methyltransferase [Dysgonomonas sp. Marseille-P4677]|uniref:precorrin-2 C(20)-methyltransferase n=1 Tax=Dysgonomonas sp. Marseille-P4677 TaxID=2364790 RepID=UPI001911D4EE|nr:precorrin-2 C(20)-methyltransferase [Dysgonomonas sp. Marseille-P4677]MBK5720386.1 precorrin-2 C(20)-methyltransferase [Dysgonomonas sp. Marseille-P4677]
MSDYVTFISLGPGDPELISLKGLKSLQKADFIFCPSTSLSGGRISSRALDILLELGIGKSKIKLFDIPMSKNRSLAIDSYRKVSDEIAFLYRKGYEIAVTAEGHAGFYSSSYYIEEDLIARNILTQQIAGIPAFIACGALANIHIVKQEEELNVIPGIISFEELFNRIEKGKTLVVMKASQCESVIKQAVIEIPNITIHYFENAGIVNKELYTQDKSEILSQKFPYFSLIIIHK